MLQARQVGRLPLRQPDHAASRVRPALRAGLLGLCVIASRCDRQVGQRWGWRWDTDRGKAIAASRTLAQPCPTASTLRLQITVTTGRYSAETGGGRSPCPACRVGISSFLVDGPRLQGGQRAINAIALWLACGMLHPAPKCSPVDSWRVPSPMAEPEKDRDSSDRG